MDLTKENVLDAVRRAASRGAKVAELATLLALDGKGRHRLRRLLEELQVGGQIERAPGARYRVPVAQPAPAPEHEHKHKVPARGVVGRIRVHPAGYGFVEREDGEEDVFVPARFRGTALDGDRVRLSTWMGYKGVEGRVDEVLARGRAKLTGVVRQAGRHVYLEPDDPRIASTWGHVALEEGAGAARVDQCVVAEIVRYPTGEPGAAGGELVARVRHVLGDPDDPRSEVLKVIACADIPDVFPDDVLAFARRAPQELRAEDFADRIDLRDREFVTIDPESARDFDDAVCVEERPGGWRIWVAVADVSHYVTPGSALDREARIRGFSVYLPDRAIPMLPHELSAGICSLNPEVDRCAMVVRIDTDPDGVPVSKQFCAAVIRSHARLDYPGVAAALGGDFRGPRARYREWAPALHRANDLARKMRARRRARGALDFDLPEAYVVLDEEDPRRVRDVRRQKASEEVRVAYQLIEEYMLAANEAVAEFFRERDADCVWRVHDVPDPERLEAFAELARSYGVSIDVGRAQDPRELQRVMREVAGQPFERALGFLLLRSLKQAQYDVVPIGHFGLASRDYLHFTSPIRRYPDLLVHRLLKWHLRREGQASGGASHPAPPPRGALAEMAAESSAHERRAQEAEREVVDMYRAYLMRDRVHEELDGMISAVTGFGIFVVADDPFVEGLVKLEALGDDRWEHDERSMRLVGRRTGRTFSLGDRVRVRVENVSVARRRIDLALIQGGSHGVPPELARPRPKPRARGEGQWGGARRGRARAGAGGGGRDRDRDRDGRGGRRERDGGRDRRRRGR